MDTMETPKYAILKWEDWQTLLNQEPTGACWMDLLVADGEVIRKQDITAAPIFHHYASQINTFIELGKKFGLPFDFGRLEQIAEHFHNAALDAEALPVHKIPD